MPQRDTRQRIERAKNAAGVEQQKAQAKTGIATWREESYWIDGCTIFYLHDPRPLDEPDVPRAQYEAEMARREQEDPYPDWETRPDLELPPLLGVDSYKISCAMRHYVPPAPAPKPKKVEPVDSPDQVALDDDIQF